MSKYSVRYFRTLREVQIKGKTQHLRVDLFLFKISSPQLIFFELVVQQCSKSIGVCLFDDFFVRHLKQVLSRPRKNPRLRIYDSLEF